MKSGMSPRADLPLPRSRLVVDCAGAGPCIVQAGGVYRSVKAEQADTGVKARFDRELSLQLCIK